MSNVSHSIQFYIHPLACNFLSTLLGMTPAPDPSSMDPSKTQPNHSASGLESTTMPPVPPPDSSEVIVEENQEVLRKESSLQSLILATSTTNLEDRMTHADVHLDDSDLTEEEIEKKRRMVLDKDRGIWFDIEDIEGNMETEYSLFPSKDELLLNKDQGFQESGDGIDEGGTSANSSTFQSQNKKNTKDNFKRFSFKGFAKANNLRKEDPENIFE